LISDILQLLSSGEDAEDDLPPPPPVFQTYGVRFADSEENLPPPPPPWTPSRSSTVAPPSPPPPPPDITMPDYSKLSLKKQVDIGFYVPVLYILHNFKMHLFS
jgi:hypothetical protein